MPRWMARVGSTHSTRCPGCFPQLRYIEIAPVDALHLVASLFNPFLSVFIAFYNNFCLVRAYACSTDERYTLTVGILYYFFIFYYFFR